MTGHNVLVFFACVVISNALSNETGDPLLLTRYIDQGDIIVGRRLARNPPIFGNIESYSGFLTVNRETATNTFFWFFFSETEPLDAPVVLWLNGGPGESSMYGALIENGPYELNESPRIKIRKHRWSKTFNMLYIDNPAGTGFSFSKGADYANDEEKVGNYLYIALLQFFQLFSELAANPLYLTGESYAGKYIPALAHVIHRERVRGIGKLNLRGVAIGNGLIDPVNMLVHGGHQYEQGLIDDEQRAFVESVCQEIENDVRVGHWTRASDLFAGLFWSKFNGRPNSVLFNETGFTAHYNILVSSDDGTDRLMKEFMADPIVRWYLHVGNLTFYDGTIAEKYLHADVMKSVLPWFVEIVENYDVLLYSGQLDIVIPYPSTVNFLRKMEWSGRRKYLEAKRGKWIVDDDIAGYTKTVKHSSLIDQKEIVFTEVLVRNAGHIVPKDQPLWAYDLISRFIRRKALN